MLIIPEYAFGALCRTDEIRLSGPTAAAVVIAETGADMTRFATTGHLAS